MTRRLFAAFLFALSAGQAFALSITPLPGSTPQHAAINQAFPNPVGVVIRDDSGNPIADAAVRWVFGGTFSHLALTPMPPGCFFDVGNNICDVRSDAGGIALLPGTFTGSAAGVEPVRASASVNSAFANVLIELVTDPAAEKFRIGVASGFAQRAPITTALPQPFVVRVTNPDGSPARGAPVVFKLSPNFDLPQGTFPIQASATNRSVWSTATDSDGYAYSAPFTVGWGMGTGHVRAEVVDPELAGTVFADFDFIVTSPRGDDFMSFADLWWGGPRESGWGVAISQRRNKLFSILFAYRGDGRPTWRVLSDGRWSKGVGADFSGPSHTTRGAPWFEYDPMRFSADAVGGMSLSFLGEHAATMSVITMSAIDAPRHLERFDFTSDASAPLHGVADMWWGGPTQSGWGVHIAERPGELFLLWFTYDANGEATWFVMSGGEWISADTFEGRLYRTTGSPFFGATYDAAQFRATDVGSVRLRFSGTKNASLEYHVDGRSGTLDLVRFDFD